MFRDCWDYICYKIQDTILKNGQKQNRKKEENINRITHRKAGFLLQKTAVVIAGILWLIAAASVFWNMPQTGVQENVLSAFGSASYKEVCADISAYGKYGSMELTDTAKEIILEKAAEKIGINRYTIEQTSRDNVETMQLSQNGENGSVLCRFITIHQENVEYEQYLYIGVTLKNTVDASFTYEKLIRQIMEEMQIDTEVNVNLKGQIHGALTDTQKEQFAQDMLDMMNAKLSVGRHMEDVYTVYAYNKGIKNYIMIGKDKVNVNICIGYDEEKNDRTYGNGQESGLLCRGHNGSYRPVFLGGQHRQPPCVLFTAL